MKGERDKCVVTDVPPEQNRSWTSRAVGKVKLKVQGTRLQVHNVTGAHKTRGQRRPTWLDGRIQSEDHCTPTAIQNVCELSWVGQETPKFWKGSRDTTVLQIRLNPSARASSFSASLFFRSDASRPHRSSKDPRVHKTANFHTCFCVLLSFCRPGGPLKGLQSIAEKMQTNNLSINLQNSTTKKRLEKAARKLLAKSDKVNTSMPSQARSPCSWSQRLVEVRNDSVGPRVPVSSMVRVSTKGTTF
ncbi:uncharacterized protein MEPE_05587 [Melanopsichium pennsylvanicum]|uniref:Uncharacterized protein n=1 Tax=Melanopsichium pennsylvanicum TaxID=63383 RepID=A0AAJ5C7T7_9BASI|nr:uncharacterized protein MEPE_05587 [Melanopsichium pennsylvanicum]